MLRIATWNVAFCHRLTVVLESVRALTSPDLSSMQELAIHQGRRDAEAIASHLGESWRFEQVTAQMFAGREQANGILWDSRRIDLVDFDTIELPTPSGRIMRRLPRQRRNAVVANLRLGELRLRLYAAHLDVFGVTHRHPHLPTVLAAPLTNPAA